MGLIMYLVMTRFIGVIYTEMCIGRYLRVPDGASLRG